jgi:ATP-dependent Clp protease protease subunit
MVDNMQNRLGNSFQSLGVNVTRHGRKIFVHDDITETSVHEIINLLEEIKQEDDDLEMPPDVEELNDEFQECYMNKKCTKRLKELLEDEHLGENNLRQPVHLILSSFGGECYTGWGLLDYLDIYDAPIYTYSLGKTFSMAFQILLKGDKRFAYANSMMMYHQGSGSMYGKTQDIKEESKEMERQEIQFENMTIASTNIPQEKIDEVREKKRNWYITPEEALEYGIIDEII